MAKAVQNEHMGLVTFPTLDDRKLSEFGDDVAIVVVDILCATAICSRASASDSAHARFLVPSRTLLLNTIKSDKDWAVEDALWAVCVACAFNDLDTERAAVFPTEDAKRTWVVEEVNVARSATSLKIIAPPVVEHAATDFLSAKVLLLMTGSHVDVSEAVQKLSGALCGCKCASGTCPARDTLSQNTASVTSRVVENRKIDAADVAVVRIWYEWQGRGSDLDSWNIAGLEDDMYSDLEGVGKSFASSYPVVCPGRTVGVIVSALEELTKVTAIFPAAVEPSALPVLVVHMPREQWQNAVADTESKFADAVQTARCCVFSNLAPGIVTLAFVGQRPDQRIIAGEILANLKNVAHPSLQFWLGGKAPCPLAHLEWGELPHFPSNNSLDASRVTTTKSEDFANAAAGMLMAHLGMYPGEEAGHSVTAVLHAPLKHAARGEEQTRAIGGGGTATAGDFTAALKGENYMSICKSGASWNALEFVKQVSLSQDRLASLFGGCVVEQYIPTEAFQIVRALAVLVFSKRSAENGNTSGGAAVGPGGAVQWIQEITSADSFEEASKMDVHLGQNARKRTTAIKKNLATEKVTDGTIVLAVRALLASQQVAAALDDLTRAIIDGDLEKAAGAAKNIALFVVDLVASAVLRGDNADRLRASLSAVSNARLSAASKAFKVAAKRRENAGKLREARAAARDLALSIAASADDADMNATNAVSADAGRAEAESAAAGNAGAGSDGAVIDAGHVEANSDQFDTAILLKELDANLAIGGEFTAQRMNLLIVMLQEVLSVVLNAIQSCIGKGTTLAIPNRYELNDDPRRKKIASLLILLLGTAGYAKVCKKTIEVCYDAKSLEALRGWNGCEKLLSSLADRTTEHVSASGAALAFDSSGRPNAMQSLLLNPAGIVLQFIHVNDLNVGNAATPLLTSRSVQKSSLYVDAKTQNRDGEGVWSPAVVSSIVPLPDIRTALNGKSSAMIDQIKEICRQVGLHATKALPSSSGGAGAGKSSSKVPANVWVVNGSVPGGDKGSCIHCRSAVVPSTSTVSKAVLVALAGHTECKKKTKEERQAMVAKLSKEVVMCGVCSGVAHCYCTSDVAGLLSGLRNNDTPADFPDGAVHVCFSCNTPAHGYPRLEVRLLWDAENRKIYQSLPLRKILMDVFEDSEDAGVGDDIVTGGLTVYRSIKTQDLVTPANSAWTLTKPIGGNWSATSQSDTFFFTGENDAKAKKRSKGDRSISSNSPLLELAKATATAKAKRQKKPKKSDKVTSAESIPGTDMAFVVASTVAGLRDNLESVILNPENMAHNKGQLKSLLQDALNAIELQEKTDTSKGNAGVNNAGPDSPES